MIAASRAAANFENANVTAVPLPDLSELFDWRPIVERCDAVVHLAGIAHKPASDDFYERVNHRATSALAQAISRSRAKHLVFISTIAAQSGSSANHELTEDDFPTPNNAYGRSKFAAEQADSRRRHFIHYSAPGRDVRRRREGKLRDRPPPFAPADSAPVRSDCLRSDPCCRFQISIRQSRPR